MSSSLPPLIGEELWPPSPELAAFLTSTEADFDAVEVFGLPKGRVAWTAFFLGEDKLLVARSIQEI